VPYLLGGARLTYHISHTTLKVEGNNLAKERDVLGQYRIARIIHNGNSTQIWEAIKSPEGTRVALKTLKPKYAEDKEEIGFMKNEYDVGKVLQHPNIIKILEFGTDKNTPFVVSELFSEVSLKKAIRKGTDTIAYMLTKIIQKASEGLYAMHNKGYVHCDIKPENFLVNRDGDVKIIDLSLAQKVKTGLAKLFGGKPKAVAGTLSYMSPEQIRAGALDPRADVYSFGCVLFELVAGKPPYTGDSPNDLLNKHISAPIPSPVVLNDNVTQDFANVLKVMMAKKPDQRYADVWEAFKVLKVTKIFKKPPRIPEVSIFDAPATDGEQV
jgi:eukaryotic-like serine/threonine-protein kinase